MKKYLTGLIVSIAIMSLAALAVSAQDSDQPFLGITFGESENGAVVMAVLRHAPADEAGLETGDIITALNGAAITAENLTEAVSELNAGDTITLDILRDGEALEIEATLSSVVDRNFSAVIHNDIVIFDGDNWHVVALNEDGPLAEAGLQAGDIITALNDESLDSEGLAALLDDLTDDASVTVTVERDGESQEITVPAGALDIFNQFSFRFEGPSGDNFREFRNPRHGKDSRENRGPRHDETPFRFNVVPGNGQLGVRFQTLNESVAAENDLSVTDGALITEVLPDSAAEAAGLQTGDVVISVDGDLVDEERTLRDRLLAYEPEDRVTLAVLRAGDTLLLDVTLGSGDIHMGNMPFFSPDDLPFDFEHGEDGALRFFFGPDGGFHFDHPSLEFEQVIPTPNL